jgi:hypothetical protein
MLTHCRGPIRAISSPSAEAGTDGETGSGYRLRRLGRSSPPPNRSGGKRFG